MFNVTEIELGALGMAIFMFGFFLGSFFSELFERRLVKEMDEDDDFFA